MAMNLGNHLTSHWEMFKHLVQGDGESAEASKDFYDEYRSVCDMTAEFYLQTIDVVFQRHLLPKGELMHRGRRVDPAAITDVALLAIEGERDDISRRRPDQGGARHLDRPAGGDEALSSRQGRRPLRHLQRQQMAQPDRARRRGLDREARLMLALAALLFAQQGDEAALRARVAAQPPAIQSFIARRANCNHWGGEEPYDGPAPARDRARRARRSAARRCAARKSSFAAISPNRPEILALLTETEEQSGW